MTPRTATLIGLTAILMWSLLAVLTVATGTTPAFQLAAMTFAIGAAVGFPDLDRPARARRAPCGSRRSPGWSGSADCSAITRCISWRLRFAPPAEAGLLNYLWPLLIVLFSSLLPGERLAPHHIIGALLGLAGTVLLFAGNRKLLLCPRPVARADRGVCRRLRVGGLFGDVAQAQNSTDRCGRRLLPWRWRCWRRWCTDWAEANGLAGHRGVTVWRLRHWGIGPVGAAFYAWDIGMKRGDIRVLGAASYATPLLSTAFLMLAGFARPSIAIAIAAVLIAGGGLIAAKDMVWK